MPGSPGAGAKSCAGVASYSNVDPVARTSFVLRLMGFRFF